MSQHPRILDVVNQLDLPDPTIPVPFEKFAALGNSDDLLTRAAFWTFYAAWLHEKQSNEPRSLSKELAVKARNDAHTIHAVTQQLALRDCVMIRQDELASLEQEAQDNELRTHGIIIWAWMAGAFLLGALVMVVILRGI